MLPGSVPCAGTFIEPDKSNAPDSTSVPPIPPSQNFHSSRRFIVTALPSPFAIVNPSCVENVSDLPTYGSPAHRAITDTTTTGESDAFPKSTRSANGLPLQMNRRAAVTSRIRSEPSRSKKTLFQTDLKARCCKPGTARNSARQVSCPFFRKATMRAATFAGKPRSFRSCALDARLILTNEDGCESRTPKAFAASDATVLPRADEVDSGIRDSMMRDARAYGKSDYQGFNC